MTWRWQTASRMPEPFLIDGHNDLAWEHRQQAGYDLTALDVATHQSTLHTDVPRLRAGGVKAQFWSVFVPSSFKGGAAVAATFEQIDFVHRLTNHYDELVLVRTADEIESAVSSGRIASLMGMEGGHSIGGSLAVLRTMYDLGVRYLTLTHNDNVPWADSATDEPALGGLDRVGRGVVAEMNRLGMIVDLSHVSADTMRDALACTEAPVMFSHSNSRAVCDVPRNVPDDVLESVKRNNGVCMVTFVPQFTSPAVAHWYQQCLETIAERGLDPRSFADVNPVVAERSRTDAPPHSTIQDVVTHIEHIREVAGLDHVGIGGDFDGTSLLTRGLEDVSAYPRLFAALTDRGWSFAEIDRLAGRNVLRVLRDVESVSRTSG